jgi:hypothetical protein
MKQYLGGRVISVIALAVIMATTTLTVQSSYAASIIFSNDHGTTFGPIMRLASNGTIDGSLR